MGSYRTKEEGETLLAEFDGNYGRDGAIWIAKSNCDKCANYTEVLSIDASESEYNPGRICLGCIQIAFAERSQME